MQQGQKFAFHGAFGTKAKARAKERTVPNSFIRRVSIRDSVRYVVLTGRKVQGGRKHRTKVRKPRRGPNSGFLDRFLSVF